MAVRKMRVNEAESDKFDIQLGDLDLDFVKEKFNNICGEYNCEISYFNISNNNFIDMAFRHLKSAAVDYVGVEEYIEYITEKSFSTYFKKDHMYGVTVMEDIINVIKELVTNIKLLQSRI